MKITTDLPATLILSLLKDKWKGTPSTDIKEYGFLYDITKVTDEDAEEYGKELKDMLWLRCGMGENVGVYTSVLQGTVSNVFGTQYQTTNFHYVASQYNISTERSVIGKDGRVTVEIEEERFIWSTTKPTCNEEVAYKEVLDFVANSRDRSSGFMYSHLSEKDAKKAGKVMKHYMEWLEEQPMSEHKRDMTKWQSSHKTACSG